MKRYILVLLQNSLFINLLEELEQDNRVYTYIMNRPFHNNILNLIRRIHTSPRIEQYIHLPSKEIWYQDLDKKIDNKICVIFTTETIIRVDLKFFKKIKNQYPSCKLVLLVMDSMHAHSMHMKYARSKIIGFNWDLVLSFDKDDCKEYGFSYLGGTFYSKKSNLETSFDVGDLYYIGYNRGGRSNLLFEIYDVMHENNVVCDFEIVGYKGNKKEGIHFYYDIIPYANVLSNVLGTNCILEILQDGQTAQTVRYYEAVCYNKKLLSNNPNLTKLPFYNSQYMKYFKTAKDIDVKWVKKKENVDYHYNNEFSPIQIIDTLEKDLVKNHMDV